jgi:hypothetical protein
MLRSLPALVLGLFLLAPAASAEDWTQLRVNQRRLNINGSGALILGGLGAASLGTGLGLTFVTKGTAQSFWEMTAAWGLVNLAIAGGAYYSATHTDAGSFSLSRTVAEQRSTEVIYALNIGLDVGYVVTGLWLWDRGQRDPSDQLLGFGRSIVLQGAMLLVLDSLLLICHAAGNGHVDALVGH